MIELGLVGTLAFAGLVLLLGSLIRRAIPALARFSVPTPVIGGLLVAVAALIAHSHDVKLFQFDTTLQSPLMIAFFTCIGFEARLSLLRIGGPQVLRFLIIASVFAGFQSVIGISIAYGFGLDPLFGVLTGTATLSGGPATGLAFAPLFESAGVQGAAAIAVAAGMSGILAGAIAGGPVTTLLIERYRLTATENAAVETKPDVELSQQSAPPQVGAPPQVVGTVVAVLVAMGIGSWLSGLVAAQGITLPSYVGAMIVAAVIRNIDDSAGWFRLNARVIDAVGDLALAFFLALALMTLQLWQLEGLGIPLIVNLFVQVTVAVAVTYAWVFRLMGRDYEAAVMGGGFLGFMLGTTANAMAVMRAVTERFGPAPRAFLVAPIVGAFFLDFSNSLIITAFVNLFR